MCAQKIKTTNILKEMKEFSMKQEDTNLKNEMLKIHDKLKESSCIYDSSTDLMKYMIQDILDYAQIKSGKFNKKIK